MKNNKGITLIALVITIVVMLILAGVSISLVVGDNGILTQAQKAKTEMDLATLKEEFEMKLVEFQANNINNGKNLTVSEFIDKLKENNIIDDNMSFVKNGDYKLTYAGNILLNDRIIDNISLSDNKTSCKMSTQMSLYDGSCVITAIDGAVSESEHNGMPVFRCVANEPPAGYKFAYWIDKNDNIVSYKKAYIKCLFNDNILTPIYVNNDTEITYKNVLHVDSIRYYKNDDSGSQYALFSVYGETKNSLVDLGILRTYDENFKNSLELDNPNVTKNSAKNINENNTSFVYKYNLTIGATSENKDKTIYYKGYAVFKDNTTGETETLYTDLVTIYPPDFE